MASKRKLQAEHTRSLLVEKGRELLDKKGYDAVTVDEIIEACGVSKGTFYHYFTSKAEFFGTLQYAPFVELDLNIVENTDDNDASSVLANYLVKWVKALAPFGPHYLASWLGHIDNPELLGEYGENGGVKPDFIKERFASIKAIIDKDIDNGKLSKDCPSDDIAYLIVSTQWGATVNICLYGKSFDIVGWAQRQAALISRLINTYRVDNV